MKEIIKDIILNIFAALVLCVIQVAVVYTLFYPFNQISFPLLFFIWKIIYKNQSKYFWSLILFFILSDLFTTFAFGISGLSAIIAIILSRNFFSMFITTYNWYSIFMLGTAAFAIDQFSIFFMVYVLPLLQGNSINYNLNGLLASVIEIILNASVLLLFYGVYTLVKPKKRYYTI